MADPDPPDGPDRMQADPHDANAPRDDEAVRRVVYDGVLQSGRVPSLSAIVSGTGMSPQATAASLQRLARGRVLVLQPGTCEILMAPPFSAVPTPFVVETPRFACFGNCIWDALGIAAMLAEDATVRTSCGDCGVAMDVHVEAGRLSGDGLVHFAVPARHWWQDVVFS